MNNYSRMFIISVLCLLSSCATRNRCLRRFPDLEVSSRLVRVDRETRIEKLPPTSVGAVFTLPLFGISSDDSLWHVGERNTTDPSGKLTLSLRYDSLRRRLEAECRSAGSDVLTVRESQSYRKPEPVHGFRMSGIGLVLALTAACLVGILVGRWLF